MRLRLACVILGLTLRSAGARADEQAHPLFLGLGLGAGAASVQPHDAAGLERRAVMCLMHVGYQLSPAWRAGLDVHGGTFAVENDWVSVNHISIGTVTFFPDAPGGLYLKAGLGVGYLNTTYLRSHSGLDVLAATGWEHHLGEQWAVGVEAWYALTRLSDGTLADASLAALLAYRL